MNVSNSVKKKFSYLLMVLSIMCFALVGCSGDTAEKSEVTPTAPVEATATPEATKTSETTESKGFEVTIIDSTQTEVKLTQEPMKIVSLAPSTTEIIAAIGAGDKLVGRTSFCNYPESITALPEVGGTMDPSVEAIVALEPDLVVGAGHAPEEVVTKLREVGIQVAFLKEDENFEGTYSTIEKLGLLTGKDEEAKKVIDEMKAKVEKVDTDIKALNLEQIPKVYYATGYGDGDWGAGGDTYIGEIINLAGATNIMQDISGWEISKEQIAEADPDIIIVPSGSGAVEAMKTTEFYKDLRAVKEGKVFEVNGDTISRQGPRVADALVEMAQKIHPEIVK